MEQRTVRYYAILVNFFLLILIPYRTSFAQAPLPTPTPAPTPRVNFAKDVLKDQKGIWTWPFHIKKQDLKTLVPLAALSAGLLVTDRTSSAWVDRNGSLPAVSRDTSKFVWAAGGISAGLYVIGKATRNDRAAKTGRLAAEALIGTEIVTSALKSSFGRTRPDANLGRGTFFRGGSSFPSGHTSTSFAVATVVSHQYRNNPWIKYGAFALATAIGLSRYSGRNHFLSDIVVGGSIGFGIGRYVYQNH